MTVFLRLEDMLEIHRQVIEATGGAAGVRDVGILDSEVHRPQAGFGGALLYLELHDQAAALLHSIAMNNPFVDGNKRTAITAMDVFLRMNGRTLNASEDEKYDFMMQVSSGQLSFPGIVQWIAARCASNLSP
jgi:death-on-curing protein